MPAHVFSTSRIVVKLLRYLVTVVSLLFTINGDICESHHNVSKCTSDNVFAKSAHCNNDSFSLESAVCLPSQMSQINTPRLSNNSTNRTSVSNKSHLGYVKHDKTITADKSIHFNKVPLTSLSAFAKTIHRLVALGRLII